MRRFLSLLALLAVVPAARATTFLPQPLPERLKSVPAVARGAVSGEAKVRTLPGGRIFTYWEFRVRDGYRGEFPSSGRIQVRQMGGSTGTVSFTIPGAAELIPGQDTVLFLAPSGEDAIVYELVGLSSGEFRVESREGKDTIQAPDLESPEPRVWELEEFKAAVQAQAPPAAETGAEGEGPGRGEPTFPPAAPGTVGDGEPQSSNPSPAESDPEAAPAAAPADPQGGGGGAVWAVLAVLGALVFLGFWLLKRR